MLVAGMELPAALTDAIASGLWVTPIDSNVVEAVFRCELVQPRFYLDYRAGGEPSVVLLSPQRGWQEVAPDARTLIALLKL